MALTVYAENMGFFHKGSGGKGIAPGDVCMTPPPPPAGPIPVPYVNIAQASDLTKGSKTVKIDGEPTALEDVSEVSTSSGNEPGSQPPKGVVTATNKGKASFTMWSFTVKVEGKGVCRHGDPMFQNESCTPPNCVSPTAITALKVVLGANYNKPCTEEYSEEERPEITKEQYDACLGGPCWECAKLPNNPGVYDTLISKVNGENQYHGGTLIVTDRKRDRHHFTSTYKDDGTIDKEGFTPDHQPPLVVVWHMGGCHDPEAFRKEMAKKERVVPHCRKHAQSQGSQASAFAKAEYPIA